MSYCTVYAIDDEGDVVHVGEARNNHAFAPYFWDVIGKKNGFGGFPWVDEKRQAEFWKLGQSGKLSERDDIIMGATCDNVWVSRENIPRLSRALREFYAEHGRIVDDDGKEHAITPTMMGIADILDDVAADESCRGACFNLCSANSNPWVVRYEDMDDEEKRSHRRARLGDDYDEEALCEFMEEVDGEERPFNFDRDVGRKRVWGKDPFELFAEYLKEE